MALDIDFDASVVWAASGAATLSGRSDGRALGVSEALVRATVDAATTVADVSAHVGRRVVVDGPALLGERAALAALTRRGDVSCGGATRLLPASDGWLAMSLARPSDMASLAAWLDGVALPPEGSSDDELWIAIGAAAAQRSSVALVERGVLLGMPLASLGEVSAADAAVIAQRVAGPTHDRPFADAIVVDLSSLWAGPLCADLLGRAGARVIKVESQQRPDGARLGTPAFFDLLHGGHESVCLDFRDEAGRRALAGLIEAADIVIEASRPRALAQLGLAADRFAGPRIWLSITGHGASAPAAERVGFGDDAAVAGGLVTLDADGPCFCADAVADPLTGLAAAAAVLEHWRAGGRWRIDAALSRVASHVASGPRTDIVGHDLAAPRARTATATAPTLGCHTDAVVAELVSRRSGG